MSNPIPSAVARKLKDVEAMMQASDGQVTDVPPVTPQQDAPVQNVPAQDAPVQDVPAQDVPAQDAPASTSDAAPARDFQAELDAAENRYRTLAGMIKVKDEEIRRLQELLTQLSTNIQASPQQSSGPSPEESKDAEDFGADMVDMVKRVAMRVLGDLPKRVQDLEKRLDHASTAVNETRKERFERRLTELVPNWRVLDTDPAFAAWLKSSAARLDMVQRYMAEFDAEGVADLFRLYEVTQGRQDITPEQQKPTKRLEQKVAPAKSVASSQPASAEKKMWTRTEIAEVYRNRRNYDDKTFADLEREIASAQREGRVDFSK